jgi:predicted ArsR family transcriptional regulator
MEQTLRITQTLADPTRYAIYEYLLKTNKVVSVAEIAQAFKIHPNVARLHLSKLEDTGVIQSMVQKTGKGGRPGKLYKKVNEPIQISFPRRDSALLLQMALDALLSLDSSIINKHLIETGKKFGKSMVENERKKHTMNETELLFYQKLDIIQQVSTMIGSVQRVEEHDDKWIIVYSIYNCPYHESVKAYGEAICLMHTGFLEGMFQTLFSNVTLHQQQSMVSGCSNCIYHVIVTK